MFLILFSLYNYMYVGDVVLYLGITHRDACLCAV